MPEKKMGFHLLNRIERHTDNDQQPGSPEKEGNVELRYQEHRQYRDGGKKNRVETGDAGMWRDVGPAHPACLCVPRQGDR